MAAGPRPVTLQDILRLNNPMSGLQAAPGGLSEEQEEQVRQRIGMASPRAPKSPSIGSMIGKTVTNQAKNMAINKGKEEAATYLGEQLGVPGADLLAGVGAGLTAYDLLTNRPSRIGGALKGGLAGFTVGGPVGALVGAPLGFAASYLNPGYSKLEEDNRKALMKAYGIDLGSVKEWESNPAFAKSRKESDLTAGDIDTAADWYLKFGPGYASASDQVKQQLAQEALNRGLVRERNGGIELELDEEGGSDFGNWAQGLLSKPAPTPSSSRRPEPKRKERKQEPERRLSLSELMPEFKYTAQPDDVAGRQALFDSYLGKQIERANRRI